MADRHTGALKEIDDPRLLLTKDYLEEFNEDEDGDCAEGKDNRDIQNEQDQVAQQLTQDEILNLKNKYGSH